MLIKFNAKTMPEYKGLNGRGELISLKGGDVSEVSDEVAKLLLQRYSRDFEVVIQEKPKHAPTADKRMKKTAKFKSK